VRYAIEDSNNVNPMAENIDKDFLTNPAVDPSENAPGEIISASDTETTNPNQVADNMEVHHHAHHEGKKNWKSYFWEFAMLFLAVFCGFLAEWQLEHVIEHSREKEFMESMMVDLTADSATLTKMESNFELIGNHADSLIPLLKDNALLDKNAKEIYQHQVYLNLFTKWIYSDRTIDQLKNSGNFRLIRNKVVSDGISKYDGYIRNFIDEMQKVLIQKQMLDITASGNDIFKSSVYRVYFNSGNFTRHSVILPDSPYFLTKDKTVLLKFINKLDQYVVSIDWFRDNIGQALAQNRALDSLIRKEYHLN